MADHRLIKECLTSPSMWPAAALYFLKRQGSGDAVSIRRHGISMYVGRGSGEGSWQAISGLDYEPELAQILERVTPGDVILDIGGNIGSYTLRLAKKTGPAGRVISFEAMEKNARLLRMNIEANHLANVTVVQKALGAVCSRVPIYSRGHLSSARLREGDDFTQVGETEMITGDLVVEELQLARVDWMKMDIEGGEPDALRGLSRTLARFRPRILFENGPAGEETGALLREAGYAVGHWNARGLLVEESGPDRGENLFAVPREKWSHEIDSASRVSS